jgi:hypothetical protein
MRAKTRLSRPSKAALVPARPGSGHSRARPRCAGSPDAFPLRDRSGRPAEAPRGSTERPGCIGTASVGVRSRRNRGRGPALSQSRVRSSTIPAGLAAALVQSSSRALTARIHATRHSTVVRPRGRDRFSFRRWLSGKGSWVLKPPTGDRQPGAGAALRGRPGARDGRVIGDSHRLDAPVRVFPTASSEGGNRRHVRARRGPHRSPLSARRGRSSHRRPASLPLRAVPTRHRRRRLRWPPSQGRRPCPRARRPGWAPRLAAPDRAPRGGKAGGTVDADTGRRSSSGRLGVGDVEHEVVAEPHSGPEMVATLAEQDSAHALEAR